MAPIARALRSNLKLRHLQLLVALDEFRHLGRTAEFLTVSQPAVSRMLSEVENMLGQTLFQRSPRGTEPTAAGAPVVRFARSVLGQYERMDDEMMAIAQGAAGRTRVGAMAGTLPVLLARAVERFKKSAPRASVLVEEGDLTHLLPKLRNGELDFLVGRLEPGYAAPDLATEFLHHDPMAAVAAPSHSLARRKRVAWADLAATPCVMPPPWASLRVKLEQVFYREGLVPPDDLVETASYLTALTFVRQRNAVAFLARSAARQFASQGECRILPIELPLELPPIGLIMLREGALSASTRQLMDCLRETAPGLAE